MEKQIENMGEEAVSFEEEGRRDEGGEERERCRQAHLVVLRHSLPVVDELDFEDIRDWDLDFWSFQVVSLL